MNSDHHEISNPHGALPESVSFGDKVPDTLLFTSNLQLDIDGDTAKARRTSSHSTRWIRRSCRSSPAGTTMSSAASTVGSLNRVPTQRRGCSTSDDALKLEQSLVCTRRDPRRRSHLAEI